MKSKVMNCFFLGILCSFFPQNTLQGTPAASPYYIGAVVEYHPIRIGKTAEAVAVANVENYITILKKAKEINSNLDIVVFPETGITTSGDGNDLIGEEIRAHVSLAASYIPNPSEKVTPCENKDTNVTRTLKTLSCAAKQYQTYIVVNHLEKEDCKNCARDNINLYNTNIVFDRFGTIIARYRKYNLFGERGTNITSEPELSTFDTDFGVKFGQFICFDILFKTPALELLEKFQVTDIAYSTHWFSMLPFFDELAVQAGWSNVNNVNLLASGFNLPATGSTGSGIYAGKDKILGTFRSETDKNAVLISKVPKVINGKRANFQNETTLYEFLVDEVSTIKDEASNETIFDTESLTDYTTKLIGPNVKQQLLLTNNQYSCYFTYKANYNTTVMNSGEKYYRYRLGIFSGERSIEDTKAEAEVCGLISCQNDSLSSCGKRFKRNDTFKDWVSFEQLEISTLVFREENTTIFNLPIALKTNFEPLNPRNFVYESRTSITGKYDLVSLRISNVQTNLMSFGIYGFKYSANGSA